MTAKTNGNAKTETAKTPAAKTPTAKAESAARQAVKSAKVGANGQADMMVNMNEMSVEMFTKTCQAYLSSWARMNGEVASFLAKRFSHDAELSNRLARCTSVTEAATLQRDWAQEAAEEYVAEANRLMELSSQVATETWQPLMEQAGAAANKALKPDT